MFDLGDSGASGGQSGPQCLTSGDPTVKVGVSGPPAKFEPCIIFFTNQKLILSFQPMGGLVTHIF